jgi:hypothetical protein
MNLFKRKFTAADLIPEQTYLVIKEFKDFDGVLHPVGEAWTFVEKNFLPYDDGLSLFVDRNGQRVQFRFQWREESQAEVIDNFSDFVEAI